MFGVVFKSDWKQIGSKVEVICFLAKNHGLTPWDFGQNFKLSKTFFKGKRQPRNDVWGCFESDWKQIGSKAEVIFFWPKTMD